jgi:tRNA (guanine-N7-)-methyltransferase
VNGGTGGHLGLFSADPRIRREQWAALKPDFERIEIEIGPGDGGFLVEAAAAAPKTLWLGMEVRPSLVARIHERAPLPANLIVLHADGRWVVENLIGRNSIDGYHVYFPDPWWKKRHHKRRLFTPGFARAAADTLRPGGRIHVITDVAPRFTEIREALDRAELEEKPWQDLPRPGRSSYERKYQTQGRFFHATAFEKSVEP